MQNLKLTNMNRAISGKKINLGAYSTIFIVIKLISPFHVEDRGKKHTKMDGYLRRFHTLHIITPSNLPSIVKGQVKLEVFEIEHIRGHLQVSSAYALPAEFKTNSIIQIKIKSGDSLNVKIY